MSIRHVRWLLPFALVACGAVEPEGPAGDAEAEPVAEQGQAIGAPGDPGGSNRCSSVCTSSSSCTKACLTLDNVGSSCGNYGVCAQSCSNGGWCSSSAACDRSCYQQGGGQIDCGQAGVCQPCSSACSLSTPCDQRCDAGPSTTTCAGYGVCRPKPPCSASVCSGPASCGTRCTHGGVEKGCDEWGFETKGDADLDGVPDQLERELARRFAPTLHLRNSLYNESLQGDLGQLYGVGFNADTPGSEWPYVVRPVTPYSDTSGVFHGLPFGSILSCAELYQCLEIIYTIPYNWDLGDDLDPAQFTSHRGDGEMYAVLVTRKDPLYLLSGAVQTPRWDAPWASAQHDVTQWTGFGEFASAHMCAPATPWGAESDSSVARGNIIAPTLPMGGGTHLFVAEGKHANYFSSAACDAGGVCELGGCSDNCDENFFVLDPAVEFGGGDGPMRNAGEELCHAHPSLDATTTNPGFSQNSDPFGSYDVWSDAPFGSDNEGRPQILLGHTVTWWEGPGYRCP
jgi:hypothetical protein